MAVCELARLAANRGSIVRDAHVPCRLQGGAAGSIDRLQPPGQRHRELLRGAVPQAWNATDAGCALAARRIEGRDAENRRGLGRQSRSRRPLALLPGAGIRRMLETDTTIASG